MIFKFDAAEGEDIEEGATQLEEALDLIQDSVAIFTLKVFEDLQGKIRSNTPDAGAFNFRLSIPDETGGDGHGWKNELFSRLNGIEKRLDEREEEEEEDAEDFLNSPVVGKIAGILGNPALQPILTNLLTAWLPKIFPPGSAAAANAQQTAVAVSSALQLQGAAMAGAAHPDQQLQDAIAALKSVDPLLGYHLVRLAKIATEKPAQYDILVGMLDKQPQ